MNWNEIARKTYETAKEKGFYTPGTIEGEDGEKMLGKLMLVCSELTEAHDESDRHKFGLELADVVIRSISILGAMSATTDRGMDVDRVIEMHEERENFFFNDLAFEILHCKKLVSYAAEDVRKGRVTAFICRMGEIIDHVIQLGAALQIDVKEAVLEKMAVNANRPYLHGKVVAI